MKKLALSFAFIASATPAFAHHPMGGETPATLAQGLLSGIGHPVLGLDHLAFVVAVGIAAVLAGSRFLLPLAFIVATVAGTLVHLQAIDLLAPEWMIAASVATVGLMIASGRSFGALAYGIVFAAAGLFHGFAYGEAVFGAETTPVLAYLAGFAATQYAIAVLAGVAIVGGSAALVRAVPARVAGGMVAGAGLLIFGEKLIEAAFA